MSEKCNLPSGLGYTASERDVYASGRLKSYPEAGCWELLAASRPLFRRPGWELREGNYVPVERDAEPREARERSDPQRDNVLRAVRRAKVKLRDYALSTHFDWFVTLTLDASRINRYDDAEVVRRMSQWCSNQVKRRGLAYLLVPERHKDGAVHFHGFFNGALEAVDSGTVIPPEGGKPRRPHSDAQRADWLARGGHVVYNLPAWTWGYTTAIGLYGDYAKAVGYVCKYVGKQQRDGLPARIGGRWYYSGGALNTPEIIYTRDTAEELAAEEGVYQFQIEEAKAAFALLRGNY